jgi:hypothetical protein
VTASFTVSTMRTAEDDGPKGDNILVKKGTLIDTNVSVMGLESEGKRGHSGFPNGQTRKKKFVSADAVG